MEKISQSIFDDGKYDAKEEATVNMLKGGKLSVEEIAVYIDLTVDQLRLFKLK